MNELIEGGVISRDTFVWKNGMNDWIAAERAPELRGAFRSADIYSPPVPPPAPAPSASAPPAAPSPSRSFGLASSAGHVPVFSSVRSDRSRVLAGILQLFLPGIGRIYLGYAAYGVLQLVLTVFTCGLLSIWSFIDGIIILTGGLKLDGYGRQLAD